MAGKFQIPSIEDIDKARTLALESKVPSHFKPNSSGVEKVTARQLPQSATFASSVSLPTSIVPSNLHPDLHLTKCLAPETPLIGFNGSQPRTASDLGSKKPVEATATVSLTEVVSLAEVSIGAKRLTSSAAASLVVTAGEGSSTGPTRAPGINSIIVNSRQKGNPILKFVRRVPWEFGDISADYQISPSSCVLYLSLKYHNLNPNYIHERLKQLANSFTLRVLLVQVDVKDPHHSLKELATMCILADCTLILAFTLEEAGRYLETYKSFENKPPDLIMEKTEANYLAKVTDVLTSARKINKTDAATLLSAFGSFEKITAASEEDLSLCPGLGPQKAQRLHKVFNQPFLKDSKAS